LIFSITDLPKAFSFSQCLHFLNRSRLEALHEVGDDYVRKLLPGTRKPFLIEIKSPQPNQLSIELINQKNPSAKRIAYVRSFVEDWFDLNTDLKQFYKLAKKDALLAPLIKQFYGLRLIGIPDFFEAISWAIIGQQINLTFAYSLKKRLVEKYGQQSIYKKQAYFLFPTPASIAQLTPEDLRPMQFSQRKAEYLIGVAQLIESGQLSKEKLSQLDFESAKKELVKIRGIGNWSANYVIMKCLLNPDAFPIEDVGLHNAIKKQLQLDQKPSLESIEQMATAWKGWKGYATFYLWQSLLD